MIVKHAINQGLAEVDDAFGKVLIESGGWVADAPAPAAKKPAAAAPQPSK